MKKCFRCQIEKDYGAFTRAKGRKDGYYPICRDCRRIERQEKSEQISAYNKKRRVENRDYYREYNKVWYVNNKEYKREYNNTYIQNRRKTDIEFKIRFNLRSRIRVALKRSYKSGSAIRDLGCSIGFFKDYIQEKFQQGMTWENYGQWELDHIIPLSNFDLTVKEQFLIATNYTNYQPLWKKDNIDKRDKLNWSK